MSGRQTLTAFWDRTREEREAAKTDDNIENIEPQSGERTNNVEGELKDSQQSPTDEAQQQPAAETDVAQLTLRRFLVPKRVKRPMKTKPRRSILPHDLSEHWSTSRSAPSASAHPGRLNGRPAMSESESEFVTPLPVRKRATIAGEWRTPVITPAPANARTNTNPTKKRHLLIDEQFVLKRPCWRIQKKGDIVS